jgi:hypothetical protein
MCSNQHSIHTEREVSGKKHKAKADEKRAKAQAQKKHAKQKVQSLQEKRQVLRSSVFAAARAGDAAAVKKGIWEDEIDAAGGEVKPDCEPFVTMPKDNKETLLHIASRQGDRDLVEWIDTHSMSPPGCYPGFN